MGPPIGNPIILDVRLLRPACVGMHHTFTVFPESGPCAKREHAISTGFSVWRIDLMPILMETEDTFRDRIWRDSVISRASICPSIDGEDLVPRRARFCFNICFRTVKGSIPFFCMALTISRP